MEKITTSDILRTSQDLLNCIQREFTASGLSRELADVLTENLGLSPLGIWMKNNGEWQSLYPDEPPISPPVPAPPDQSIHTDSSGTLWWYIRGSASLPSGLLAFGNGNPDDVSPVFKELLPTMRVYFRELKQEPEVTKHELVEFDEHLSLDYERARRTRNLDEILDTLMKTVTGLFECDRCRLFWLENEDLLRLRAESSEGETESTDISVEEDPMIQSVVRDEKSIIINNLPEHDHSRPMAGDIRSFLSVPFRFGNKVRGTLNLSSEDEDVFTRDQLQQLSTVADNVGFIYQMTRELANITEYVEKILANLPVGVINIEPRQQTVHMNQRAQSILDMDREILEISSFRSRLQSLGGDKFLEYLDNLSSNVGTRQKEFQLESRSSYSRTVEAFFSNVKEVEREVNRRVIVLNDVTEQRLLAEQVNRAERLSSLGELAASLAHEIKNPLTSIQGFIQLLPERSDDEDFIQKASEVIERESRRLNALVENLVSFGKPQVGSRSLFSVSDLLDDVELLMRKKMEKQKIEFRRKCDDNLKMYGDSQKIKQVFINLLLNAIDAVDRSGTIELRAREDAENFVILEVEDDGEGISPEMADRVINPFYTTKEEGTGLGLAISHRIVEEHGGRLEFDSEVGVGTTVCMIVPPRDLQGELGNENEQHTDPFQPRQGSEESS